ncbi:MAG: hypothetical protein R3Y54_13450, partial [Eubacteriales bacterium]
HFKGFMDLSQIEEVKERCAVLRNLLMNYVNEKHLQDRHVDMDKNINYMKFDKIHYSREMKWIKYYYKFKINKLYYMINMFKWKKYYNFFK